MIGAGKVGYCSELPACKSIYFSEYSHSTFFGYLYLGNSHFCRAYLVERVISEVPFHIFKFKTFSIFPCGHRYHFIRKLFNKVFFYINIIRPVIYIVLPGKDIYGRVDFVTLLFNDFNCCTPIACPLFHPLFVFSPVSPLFIPKTFGKQHISFYFREHSYYIFNQFSQPCFIFRGSHILPYYGCIDFDAIFSSPVNNIFYSFRILEPHSVY